MPGEPHVAEVSTATSSPPDQADTRRRWWRVPVGVQALLAVALGAALGTVTPAVGEHLKILGDVFLHLVQMVVVPLVFPLIVLGIARMESMRQVGRIAAKTILYFEIVTTLILVLAVGLGKVIGVGKGAPVNHADAASLRGLSQGVDFQKLLLDAVPSNVVAAFSGGNLLAVIVFAVFVGVAMAALGEKSAPVRAVLDSWSSVMFRIVGYVIRLAPVGVLGYIAYDVAHYGLRGVTSLLGFVSVVYLGLAVVVGVLFPLIAVIFRVPYLRMLRSTADLAGIAFVTRSSEAVLAPLLSRLESFGVDRSVTSLVVPLGYSFNTDGSTLYQGVALVFLANAYGTNTSFTTLLLMVLVLVVLSKGMAGVASASIVVLIAAGNTIGLPPQGIALLIGVDFIVDMARTAINVVGNSLAAAVIGRSERAFVPSAHTKVAERV
jgi:proton glutamate symport protein